LLGHRLESQLRGIDLDIGFERRVAAVVGGEFRQYIVTRLFEIVPEDAVLGHVDRVSIAINHRILTHPIMAGKGRCRRQGKGVSAAVRQTTGLL